MNKLSAPCFTVQDGQIIEGKLSDFDCYIETTTRPQGVGYKYYVTTRDRVLQEAVYNDDDVMTSGEVRGDIYCLAKWATWGGPEVIIREFESEQSANDAAEESYVHDILNNSDICIHLDRESAEQDLASQNE